MSNEQKHEKAKKHLHNATKELKSALLLIADTLEYNNTTYKHHKKIINKYDAIVMAYSILTETKKI